MPSTLSRGPVTIQFALFCPVRKPCAILVDTYRDKYFANTLYTAPNRTEPALWRRAARSSCRSNQI
jgi:hypothetical protein